MASLLLLHSVLVPRPTLPPQRLALFAAAPARRSSGNSSAPLHYFPAVLGGCLFPYTRAAIKKYSVSATASTSHFFLQLFSFLRIVAILKNQKSVLKRFKGILTVLLRCYSKKCISLNLSNGISPVCLLI